MEAFPRALVCLLLATLVSSVFGADDLRISKAYCGAGDSWRDVTAFLQDQVKDGTLQVHLAQPYQEIGGDPAPGQVKNLLVDYQLNGTPYRLSMTEQYPTAFTITLPATEPAAPGSDPNATAVMTAIQASLAANSGSRWSKVLAYGACAASVVALVVALGSMIQVRQLRKQLSVG